MSVQASAPPMWPGVTDLLHGSRESFYPHESVSPLFLGAENGGDAMETELDELSREERERKALENEIVEDRSFEGMVIVTVSIVVTALGATLFYAFVFSAFSLVHGYPSIGASPGAPGPFYTQRYSAQWVLVYLLAINYTLPALLALAVATPGRITGVFLHRRVTALAGIINVISTVGLFALYLIYCNGANATWNAMANDPAWCCVHAAKNAVANDLCGAIDPLTCVPTRTASSLNISTPYFWTMIGGLLFTLNAFFHLQLNSQLPRWKLWNLRFTV